MDAAEIGIEVAERVSRGNARPRRRDRDLAARRRRQRACLQDGAGRKPAADEARPCLRSISAMVQGDDRMGRRRPLVGRNQSALGPTARDADIDLSCAQAGPLARQADQQEPWTSGHGQAEAASAPIGEQAVALCHRILRRRPSRSRFRPVAFGGQAAAQGAENSRRIQRRQEFAGH